MKFLSVAAMLLLAGCAQRACTLPSRRSMTRKTVFWARYLRAGQK